MSSVLIVSNTGDIHCDFLVDACARVGRSCFRLNTDRFRKTGLLRWQIDTGDGVLEIDGRHCQLAEVGLLIYRRPVPAHQLRTDIEPWVGRLLDAEWTAVEAGLSQSVRGKVMNGLAGSALAQNKIAQLHAARRSGLNVPETIISTDAVHLREFARAHLCVTKGIVNAFHIDGKNLRSAFTSRVDAKMFETYDPEGSPTLLQKAIETSALWRIVVVGKKTLGFRFHGPELSGEADSRRVEQSLEAAHLPVPSHVAARIVQMCSSLSIEFASADFVEDGRGEVWFLDLNPEGQWAFLEDKFGVRISDVIVSLGSEIDAGFPGTVQAS